MRPDLWEDLAALAYSEFLLHGRGALLLGEVGDLPPALSVAEPAPIGTLAWTYVDQAEAARLDRDGPLRKHIADYDPEAEVLVLVLDTDGIGHGVHRLEQRPRPADIYTARAGRPSVN